MPIGCECDMCRRKVYLLKYLCHAHLNAPVGLLTTPSGPEWAIAASELVWRELAVAASDTERGVELYSTRLQQPISGAWCWTPLRGQVSNNPSAARGVVLSRTGRCVVGTSRRPGRVQMTNKKKSV